MDWGSYWILHSIKPMSKIAFSRKYLDIPLSPFLVFYGTVCTFSIGLFQFGEQNYEG